MVALPTAPTTAPTVTNSLALEASRLRDYLIARSAQLHHSAMSKFPISVLRAARFKMLPGCRPASPLPRFPGAPPPGPRHPPAPESVQPSNGGAGSSWRSGAIGRRRGGSRGAATVARWCPGFSRQALKGIDLPPPQWQSLYPLPNNALEHLGWPSNSQKQPSKSTSYSSVKLAY